ncbi:VOC family protein [Streptomyces kunmingensis]|uniref:VOC family protein n=1 Tax=Streptomyces kunmingensis TaxID=68225 RepID=A0ABU6CC65_9ACTN|nr:VOC family protein [Streptomyces kunmingensis]MEB3962263.1 VOC family protein [Streptomyces kunmingensis]
MTDSTVRMDAIGISATDLTASLAFYRLLGLTFPEGANQLPHVEARLPGGIRLMFDPDSSGADHGRGRIALAFHCGDAAGVDATYAALTDAGHHGESKPWDAVWGQRYAVVHDPDGNQVDLFA